jgi:ribose transport system permease protein
VRSVAFSLAPRVRAGVVIERARAYGVVVALGILIVVFAASTPAFLTVDNLRSLAEQSAQPALVACGMTAVIIAGEFDLSAGAIFGFGGVIAAIVANEAGVAAAVGAAVGLGAGLGLINGIVVSRGGIESFLVTLATQFVFLGLAVYVTGGTSSWQVHDAAALGVLAHNTLFGVQLQAWIALTAFALMAALLRRTGFGKQVFAVGGNVAAARIAGVRLHAVRTAVFALSGGCAALAGVLAVSDTSVAQAGGGIGMEFAAITAVIVGGTSIAGGRGSVWRTLAGVVLLAVIANGFTLLYIDPTYNLLVQGLIILAAVVLDARLKKGGLA